MKLDRVLADREGGGDLAVGETAHQQLDGALIALSEPLTVLAGLALSPLSPLSGFGDYFGAIAHGLIWLTTGATLRARASTVVRMPVAA